MLGVVHAWSPEGVVGRGSGEGSKSRWDRIMQGPISSQFRTRGPGEVVKRLQFIRIPAPAVGGMDQKRAET